MFGVSVEHLRTTFLETVCSHPKRVRYQGEECIIRNGGPDGLLDLAPISAEWRTPPSWCDVARSEVEILELLTAESKIYEIEVPLPCLHG